MGKLGPVWVIAEQGADGQLEPVSLQLVGKAAELAAMLGASCEALLLGYVLAESAELLIALGADRVYLADSPELQLYQPELYTKIICSLAEEHKPEIVLSGSTYMGRELAPLVAAHLRTGLAAHCTGLQFDEDMNLEQMVPAYGGLMSIICPGRRPQMATIARGVFRTPDPDPARNGEIIPVSVPDAGEPRVRTLEIIGEKACGARIEDATVIVCGGAGAGSVRGWEMIGDLAESLDAALGCTRPAADEGWAPLDLMIGQSGKMAGPEIYIGVGVSGEQQHMVGLGSAKLMIAINNDPNSPIFQQVDLGIVEDCREFLPLLIERIRAFRSKRD